MNSTPITVWLALTALVAFFALLTIWSRGVSWPRTLSVVSLLLAGPLIAASLAFTLGCPVPLINGVTAPSGKLTVLGGKMVINKGIYILVDLGDFPPLYLWKPWDQKTADAMQDAMAEAGREGDVFMDVPPFEWSWDQNEPQFHALPQPKVLPDKPPQEQAPEVDSDSI